MIALLLGTVAWVVVPYNNFYLDNTYLSDSYLPEIVIGLLLVIILVVNPLLKLLGPSWMLTRPQVALIASLLLFAAVVPSNGLMRMFPRFVAEMNAGFHESVTTSKIAADAGFRQELFPDPLPVRGADGEVKTFDTPVSDQFIDELDEGGTIPWSAWVVPMMSWGALIFAMWMMMLGLGGVVFPQWRDRERLPFPLLNVYHSFFRDPQDPPDRALPAVFTSRTFWTACIVVMIIHALRGLNIFTGAVPSFPLEWNISSLYEDNFMRHSTLAFKRHNIFFALVGVAYFIPSRYAVSIWAWMLGYSIYITFGRAYIPAFQPGHNDQIFGVLVSIVLWVVWLGRNHWYKVGRAMLGTGGGTAESRRDAIAGWMFVLGCAGMLIWLTWMGVPLWFSVLCVVSAVVVALLMARIVAETGVPFFWLGRIGLASLAAYFPVKWQSPQALLMTGAFYALVTRASAVNATVMSTLALGMDREGGAKHQTRVLIGGLAVLAVGFVVCGAVHLNMGYSSADVTTNPKTAASVIDAWAGVERTTYDLFNGSRGDQAIGFGIGAGLLWACSRFPAWPIHPVGFLFVMWSLGYLIWFSIFLGWLIKVGVISMAGGAAYRKARPLFLGLILGELISIIVWTLVPIAIMLWTGMDAEEVPRYMLIKYP